MKHKRTWKADLYEAIDRQDHDSLRQQARGNAARVIRYFNSRLYTQNDEEKEKVIKALGIVVADSSIVPHWRAEELLRRFAWALNDESGAVPYGVPEAMGEVLAVRPEFQKSFLPILCSLLTEDDMSQTGPIERGAVWAAGRVGTPVAEYSKQVVEAVRRAADQHPDQTIRSAAMRSLAMIEGAPNLSHHEQAGKNWTNSSVCRSNSR